MDLTIAFDGIEIKSFEIKPKPVDLPIGQFKMEMNVSISPIKERNLAVATVNIKILDLATSTELAFFALFLGYRIENFDEVFTLKENGFLIPDSVTTLINSMSLSTARGVLWSQLRGTYLFKAILPVIDMSTLKQVDLQNGERDYKVE